MKLLNIVTLCLSTLISSSSWGVSTFTNITDLNSSVFAGVKVVEEGMEMKSHLMEVKLKDLSSSKVTLPEEIDNREIVGLFPARDKYLIVVTQNTRGGGDRPTVHSFNLSSQSWKKIGVIDCISFADVKVIQSSLEFSCEVTSPKGEVKKEIKKIDTKLALKPQSVTLPVTKVQVEGSQVSLIEEDLDWTKLQITKGKDVKTFTP